MFTRLFKSNQPFILFFLPILGLLLWIKPYLVNSIETISLSSPNNMMFYNQIEQLISYSNFHGLQIIIAYLLILLQTYIVIGINQKYQVTYNLNYAVGFFFLLFASSFISLNKLNPIIFSNLFFLLAIYRVLGSHDKLNALSNFFDASFFLSVSVLFYFNMIFFIFVIWASLIILRPFIWREWLVTLIGFITPIFLFFSYIYISNDNFIDVFVNIPNKLFIENTLLEINLSYLILFGIMAILIISASKFIFSSFSKTKIRKRNYYKLFFVIFLLTVFIYILSPSVSIEIFLVSVAPFSFLLANYINYNNSRWFELFIILYIGAIIFEYFTYNNESFLLNLSNW